MDVDYEFVVSLAAMSLVYFVCASDSWPEKIRNALLFVTWTSFLVQAEPSEKIPSLYIKANGATFVYVVLYKTAPLRDSIETQARQYTLASAVLLVAMVYTLMSARRLDHAQNAAALWVAQLLIYLTTRVIQS